MDSLFALDPTVLHLNHGSYGACPKPVLAAQQRFRDQMERNPMGFMSRELEGLLDQARSELADFLGADTDTLAFVPNATTGVNAVLQSLRLTPGDELLTTNHGYNACRNALECVAQRTGAHVVVCEIPFPLQDAEQILQAVHRRVGPRTRLALLDHVTSPTALVFPIAALVADLQTRGIDVLVDGAHAPGMLPLDLRSLNAAYYVGNCHKWLCAPKGAAFLHVRPDRQAHVHPTVISHGANSARGDRSRFRLEFDWVGTQDFSAYLAVPEAIRTIRGLCAGGFTELMERNRTTALQGRLLLASALGIGLPCPDSMIGSMAALPLPDGPDAELQIALAVRHRIEIPIFPWPSPPHRLIRISAQHYNQPTDYEHLARALDSLLR